MCQKRGRQAGPHLTLWAAPRPPLVCCGLLNYADFAGPGFSVPRVGRASSFQPPFSGRMAARGLEVDSDSALVGKQASWALHSYTVFIYLFSLVGLRASQPHLSALSPACYGDPSSGPASLVLPCGEPLPETGCWIQGSRGYPGADTPNL